MAQILLVHGAAHGAWCWDLLVPHLAARGHQVLAIDLPGHGQDPTPLADVTLQAYVAAILDALAAMPKPAVVVGHSMGGYPISLAAERAPGRVARLVYLCAYVPWPDLTLSQMRKLASRHPVLEAIEMSADRSFWTVRPDAAQGVFYGNCSPDLVQSALPRLRPQAMEPQSVSVDLGARYAMVPRSYIRCLQDNAIPIDMQTRMAADFPKDQVFDLDTDHSPFLSQPEDLAALLDQIATR